MKENYLENIIINDLSSLDVYNASAEILRRMKFLDKNSKEYKFKEIANQVVVETNDFFYKIYIDYGASAKYMLEIRKKLSQIYESYGVHWKLKYSYYSGRIVTIEQREKLRLCKYGDMSCEELLKNWNNTLKILKENLKFNDILSQIKEKSNVCEFKNAKELLLIKKSLIKPDDYAYAPNGEVILLDDADFFIFVIDEKGLPISFKNFDMEIMTTCGKMNFSSNMDFWEKRVYGQFDMSKSFFVLDKSVDNAGEDVFISNDNDTISKELKLFATGKKSSTKYKSEYYAEYNKKHNFSLSNTERLNI